VTLILAPDVGLLAWAHYAPILADSFRKTYRRLLRWNDELPFVKFALSEDERIMLTAEVPSATLDRDAVGRTLARLVAVSDLLHEESTSFLGDWAKLQPTSPTALLERYAADVAELEGALASDPDGSRSAALGGPARTEAPASPAP
jgi:hypothetical protein